VHRSRDAVKSPRGAQAGPRFRRVGKDSPSLCADCGKRPRYGKLKFCAKCALSHGWAKCTACTRMFEPEPAMGSTTRCYICVTQKRRKAGRGGSVRTVSGGLPSLGKHR
jgi:hypothetical protein